MQKTMQKTTMMTALAGLLLAQTQLARHLASLPMGAKNGSVRVELQESVPSGVADVDRLILGDVDAKRRPEVLPLAQEVAIRIEDLDAKVLAVANVDEPLFVHGDPVGQVELAFAGTGPAPGLHETPLFGKLHDARVVAVRDIDLPTGTEADIGGSVEAVGGLGGETLPPEDHQHPAHGVHFDRDMRAVVHAPHVALGVDADAVGVGEEVRTEGPLEVAVLVKD